MQPSSGASRRVLYDLQQLFVRLHPRLRHHHGVQSALPALRDSCGELQRGTAVRPRVDHRKYALERQLGAIDQNADVERSLARLVEDVAHHATAEVSAEDRAMRS